MQTLFISEQNGTIVHVHTEGNLPRNRKVESLIACITLVTAIENFLRFNNEVFDNILKLSDKENKTKPSKNHDKERIKIQKKFRENEDVKKYLENVKNGVKNEKKIADNYKKAYKTYQKELKNALKEYHKTETGKLYKKR